MKLLLSLVLFIGTAFAQTTPQAVAVVISPDMAAFASMTPKPDFPAEWIVKLKLTEPGQVFKISITCIDPLVKVPAALVTWEQSGWQKVEGQLPAGCKVATGGISLALLTAGTPATLPIAQ